MNKQDIEESVKSLENFTTNICSKFDIENDDEVLEVRDYVTIRKFKKKFDQSIFEKNEGNILYLMHFKICDDVFPIIEMDTIHRKIRFEVDSEGGSIYLNMLDDGSCLQNLKSVLPYFKMLVCKLIDYKQSLNQHNSDEFLQTLQRDFVINEVLEE
tara:strand:- start:2512 stop:2979 length:468 start_codon:yes stop_codon:yes gene_type:complete